MDKIGSDPLMATPLYPHLGALEATTNACFSSADQRFTWIIYQDEKAMTRGLVFALESDSAARLVRDAALDDNIARPFRVEIYGGMASYVVMDTTVTQMTRSDGTEIE